MTDQSTILDELDIVRIIEDIKKLGYNIGVVGEYGNYTITINGKGLINCSKKYIKPYLSYTYFLFKELNNNE